MDIKQEMQILRSSLVRGIDTAFDEFFRKLENPDENSNETNNLGGHSAIYPLTVDPGVFKGKKPSHLIIDGKNIPVYSWKKVFLELMKMCDADPDRHKALINLRGLLSGRTRAFISDKKDGMRSPLEINENLYAETHYDTETLLKILLHRILDEVDFDYTNISVAIRDNKSK